MIFAEYYANRQKKKKKERAEGLPTPFQFTTVEVWNCKGASDLSLELFAIFELVTALKVKAMRNKKRRRKIFMGPCTKPAYTGKGFRFRVFHRTNEFSINSSFFRLFVRPVCHFGTRYSNERKNQRETKKPHVPPLITESPKKGSLQASA